MNRRYKVFLSDLEKTLFYALSHEVAQHATIAGIGNRHHFWRQKAADMITISALH